MHWFFFVVFLKSPTLAAVHSHRPYKCFHKTDLCRNAYAVVLPDLLELCSNAKTFCQSSSNVLGTLSVICYQYGKEKTTSTSMLLMSMLQDDPPVVITFVFSTFVKSPYFLLTLSSRSTNSCNCISEQASKIMSSAYLKLVTLQPPISKPPS